MNAQLHKHFIAPGAYLPDPYALKVVDKMMTPLRDYITSFKGEALWKRIDSFGNPKGAIKLAQAMHAEGPDASLLLYVDPYKRMKSIISCDKLAVSANQTELCGARTLIIGLGPNRMPYISHPVMMSFTRHALQRLVQRAGLTTPASLMKAIREAWVSLSSASTFGTRFVKQHHPEGGYAIPAPVKGKTFIFVVVPHPVEGESGWKWSCVTVLSEEMIDDRLYAPIEAYLRHVLTDTSVTVAEQVYGCDGGPFGDVVCDLLPKLVIPHWRNQK